MTSVYSKKLNSKTSSDEDCSIETELLTNEFHRKTTLADGNNSDDDLFSCSNKISNSAKALYYQETTSPSSLSPLNTKKQQQQTATTTLTSLFSFSSHVKQVQSSPSPSSSSNNLSQLQQQYRFADECEYRMNNLSRGVALIINNKKFHSSLDMPVRNGTDKDAASLQQTFYKLGFSVKLEHNKSASDMRDMLNRLAKCDHSDSDAFVCCILSHGEEGLVYGTDQSVEIEHLIAPFKLNRTLAGKPKLFFIQACRGTKLMDGIDTNPYKVNYVNKIPMEADFLVAYSTIAGYYSWRNNVNGSWFIQSLCDVLNQYGHKLEIMQLLTMVNRKVAYYYESNAGDSSMSGKRQVPCIVSMLTKELFFKPKTNQINN